MVDGKQSSAKSISSTVSPNYEDYQVIDDEVAIEIAIRESKVSENIFSKVDSA